MKRFVRDLLFLAIAGLLLWLLLPRFFGINLPLGGREPPTIQALNDRIRLPDGFSISIYATGLPGVRILLFTDRGDLLVSLPRSGRIVLLERGSGINEHPVGRKDLLEGLNRPHGIALHDGWLHVAETDAIGRARFDSNTRSIRGAFAHIVTGLPAGGDHWSKTIHFGPDGWMYVSVGSSCNVCREKDPRRAAILRFHSDGSGGEIVATGLRNTVGFDWRPSTGRLYGVDNGRDFLGDDFPPCELNRIDQGGFYGWPYANGDKVPDPDFGKGNEEKIGSSIAPAHAFGAHTAPLGITFLRSENLPSAFRGSALITLHGSWNRSEKAGYAVMMLHFDERGRVSERPFISGFEVADDVIGRPVDVVEGPDGGIYISDDYTGTIYRVVYAKTTDR